MKRNILLTLILMLCVLFAQGKTRKAIFIIVDGVPADCVERLQPPTLSAIAQEGGYSRGYCGGEIGSPTETIFPSKNIAHLSLDIAANSTNFATISSLLITFSS